MSASHEHENLRKFLESGRYQELRLEMNRAIQHPIVRIDRHCFMKTPEEKAELKIIKQIWKANQQNQKQ